MTSAPRCWRWGEPLAPLVEALELGHMVTLPTESSYALAVDPRSVAGVAAVFAFKGCPPTKPLPVVLGDPEQLRQLGGDPGRPELAELAAVWPAPLTVVVPIEHPLPATAGRCTVAVRVPAHRRLRHLLRALERPLTATSANPSGGEPVTRPEQLRQWLAGWPSVLVDDGELPGGPPSTLVDPGSEGIRVLREGAISITTLRTLVTGPVFSAASAEILADDSRQSR